MCPKLFGIQNAVSLSNIMDVGMGIGTIVTGNLTFAPGERMTLSFTRRKCPREETLRPSLLQLRIALPWHRAWLWSGTGQTGGTGGTKAFSRAVSCRAAKQGRLSNLHTLQENCCSQQ